MLQHHPNFGSSIFFSMSTLFLIHHVKLIFSQSKFSTKNFLQGLKVSLKLEKF